MSHGRRSMAGPATAALLALALIIAGCAHAPSAATGAAPSIPGAGATGRESPTTAASQVAPGATPADTATAPFDWSDRQRVRLSELRKTEGRVNAGDVVTRWTAYYESDSLRALTEHIEVPDYSPRDNEYFFSGGELRVFTSNGSNALTGPSRERGPYVMAIAFERGGQVSASRKTVSGAAVAVEDFEAIGARGRAQWLIAIVRQASPGALR